ncbi:MAG: hypothetical protein AAF572_09680 [Cyanobacteria bacterium P01_B01_bin.77]
MSSTATIPTVGLVNPWQLNPTDSPIEDAREYFENLIKSHNKAFDRVQGAIEQKWVELGDVNSFLGFPTTDERKTRDKIGRYNHFEGGSIFWSPSTGAHEVHGAIREKWDDLGWERSFLGYPITDETVTPDTIGRYNHFQGGSIYWTPNTGAHEVHGAIREKWADLGWERSFLGYPTTDETKTRDKKGRYNHFEGGSIFWSPNTGAHEVHGLIRNKWADLGWERSFLGYPITDETATPDNIGRYNHFQGGSIYWTPDTGAHEVHGAIRDKWAHLGWEQGFLGYPVTDESITPDKVGRYNHFQGGSIYWTPNTGANEVHGDIRHTWANLGWEKSFLGYPLTDELSDPNDGKYSVFEGGVLHWEPSTGTKFANYEDIPANKLIEEIDEFIGEADPNLYFTGPTEIVKVHDWYEHDKIAYHRVLEIDLDMKYSRTGRNPEVDLDLFLQFNIQNGEPNVTLINAKTDVDFPWWYNIVTFGIVENLIAEPKFKNDVEKFIGKNLFEPGDFYQKMARAYGISGAQLSNVFFPFAVQPQDDGSIRTFYTLDQKNLANILNPVSNIPPVNLPPISTIPEADDVTEEQPSNGHPNSNSNSLFESSSLLESLTNRGLITNVSDGFDSKLNNNLIGSVLGETIAGGEGDDAIFGADGDDILRGDNNSKNTQVGTIGGDDFIDGGAGDDRIGGKSGNDILLGNEGNDQLWGDDGDDILHGGLGNDTLTGDDFSGGQGSDTFVLIKGHGTDTITDFEIGIDFIGIIGDLSYDQLIIGQAGENTTISIGDETLAVLNQVDAAALSQDNFKMNFELVL